MKMSRREALKTLTTTAVSIPLASLTAAEPVKEVAQEIPKVQEVSGQDYSRGIFSFALICKHFDSQESQIIQTTTLKASWTDSIVVNERAMLFNIKEACILKDLLCLWPNGCVFHVNTNHKGAVLNAGDTVQIAAGEMKITIT